MIPESNSQFFLKRTIRPFATAAIHGLAFYQGYLMAIDPIQGYLLQINMNYDNPVLLNPYQVADFLDGRGLAIGDDTLWFSVNNQVFCSRDLSNSWGKKEWDIELFLRFPDPIEGIGVVNHTLYVISMGVIFVYSIKTKDKITQFSCPGVGRENMTIKNDQLWISDTVEQSVFCLDRATGELVFSVLTPFTDPTGLAFDGDTLYVAYSQDEPYIRDNPNRDPCFELEYRDRTFIHPLYFYYDPVNHYALSNGFLIEMCYVEELAPLEQVALQDVAWAIALPSNTNRQKVRRVEPIGLDFTEEIHDGQKVAVFKFDALRPGERHIFGWKALIEVWSIKYRLTPNDVEQFIAREPDLPSRYLLDDDNLAMDSDIVRRAARAAIGRETNLLRQMYSIRNYVYDQLSYGLTVQIDKPDEVLKRGVGSCGEYLGVLLALSRLNGIACRTIGRYKCPNQADLMGVPLIPDYNHVWMEFFIPGFGWVPMESNPDDIGEGPYPTRFFMGLAWYHAEIGKGIKFETIKQGGVPVKKEEISIGNLAINHVRFTIVDELIPKSD